jgi:hypothetical protein
VDRQGSKMAGAAWSVAQKWGFLPFEIATATQARYLTEGEMPDAFCLCPKCVEYEVEGLRERGAGHLWSSGKLPHTSLAAAGVCAIE